MFRYHYLFLFLIGFNLVYVDSKSKGNKNDETLENKKRLSGVMVVSDVDGLQNESLVKKHLNGPKAKSLPNEEFTSVEEKREDRQDDTPGEKDSKDNTSKEREDNEVNSPGGKDNEDNSPGGKDNKDNSPGGKDNEDNSPGGKDNEDNTLDKKDNLIRPLKEGDFFTAKELLPVTEMLLSKVENPGEGNGIVTSSKSPEELADKIFAGFFLTTKIIALLDDDDIKGLDALQALALDKTAAQNRRRASPVYTMNYGGTLFDIEETPRSSQFTLLFKENSPRRTLSKPGLRSRNRKRPITPPPGTILKLEKNMQPNRHLILNHRSRKSNRGRKHIQRDIDQDYDDEDKESQQIKEGEEAKKKGKGRKSKNNKKNKRNRKSSTENATKKQKKKTKRNNKKKKNIQSHKLDASLLRTGDVAASISNNKTDKNEGIVSGVTTTMKPVCTWRYVCENHLILDTCKLHTSCLDDVNNTPRLDRVFVDHEKEKEENKLNEKFRKAFGLSMLDEEVEKIIESRILKKHPHNMWDDKSHEKYETLNEYFAKVIMYQNAQSTPRPDSAEGAEHDYDEFQKTPPLYKMIKIHSAEYQTNLEDDDEQYRRKNVETNKTSTINKEENKSILKAPVSATTIKINTGPK
ncbi:uncharacterized protein LOC118273209 isoform X9 [Spodoptera frugiperda]|uniref:Uncharacterized protein LOC118273209 isoform X9 n=1 Tax=Spodoptera frugiperda TaxID=7108 RepID=A0A9R0DNA7_SPOFR|nr:uncharacterized protein LOC118273209 isoform X9 [Spodoptera frugiperda]